jgi:general stress protein 26
MLKVSDAAVAELLNGHYIASMATINPGGLIHMVAVWYWFDGQKVFVTTFSRSRKARNVQSNPKVSLMVDARDPAASRGVTVMGTGRLLTGNASAEKTIRIHQKYLSAAALEDPAVGKVFTALDDVTIEITPESVVYWNMQQTDQQFFGGAMGKHPDYLLPTER